MYLCDEQEKAATSDTSGTALLVLCVTVVIYFMQLCAKCLRLRRTRMQLKIARAVGPVVAGLFEILNLVCEAGGAELCRVTLGE